MFSHKDYTTICYCPVCRRKMMARIFASEVRFYDYENHKKRIEECPECHCELTGITAEAFRRDLADWS